MPKKLVDWLQSKAIEAPEESFTEVLTRLREYMLLDGRPKSSRTDQG